MNIGKNIRHIRLKMGLSQENVAEMLHISTTAYGDIERNTTEVTVSRLIKIAKILGVNYNEFIGEISKKDDNKAEVEMLKAELLLAQIESDRWKERFMRSVFQVKKPDIPERKRIGFK
jgi:transcriptional regulator with XRE-family HTH domain